MNHYAIVLCLLILAIAPRFVAATSPQITLTVTPTADVAVGTKLAFNSCWIGFTEAQLSNAFFTGNATIDFSLDGGTWAGLPAILSGYSGNQCYGSTYVVPQAWAGHTVGLRATFRPTGQTSNVVGLVVLPFSQSVFVVQVSVVDQNGNDYDGVAVYLWQGSDVVDSGMTNGGSWTSMPVEGGGRTYNVEVYNGRAVTAPIRVISSNVFIAFQLTRKTPSPNLLVSAVKISPNTVMIGSAFSTTLVVSNIGSLDAETATLSLNLTYPFATTASGTTLNIGYLAVNSTAEISVEISIDRSAKSGVYSIPYSITFTDADNYTYTNSGTFGVTINGIPQVAIASVSIDPSNISPETNGFLTLSLANTGTAPALNIQVRIFGGDDILTSTLSYVGEIDPGNQATMTFGVSVIDSAALGARSLSIDIRYNSPNGTSYETAQLYNTYVYPLTPFISTLDIVAVAVVVLVVLFAYIAFRRQGYRLW